jgi:hypothetical protein
MQGGEEQVESRGNVTFKAFYRLGARDRPV